MHTNPNGRPPKVTWLTETNFKRSSAVLSVSVFFRLGRVVVLAVCGFTSTTHAQTFTNFVRYSASGEVQAGPNAAPTAPVTFGGADQMVGHSLTEGVFLERDFQASQTSTYDGSANASASLNVSAFAVPGTLRVNATGVLTASTTTPYNFASGVATVGFDPVSASWADTALLSVPLAEPGRSFTFYATLYLDGDMAASVSKSGAYGTAEADIRLALSGSGVPPGPYAGGYWGRVYRDISNPNNDIGDLPGGAIPLAIPMPNGEFVGFNYTMFVTGQMRISNQAGFVAPGFGTTDCFFAANFGQSLRWGGVSGVIDTETGQPVTDWTITSESGFDYSQPVPEPATLAIAALGGLLLLRRKQSI
jgi:hypothetical protein